MRRLALTIAIGFALAPAAALANPLSDSASVGMSATVVESCTLSPHRLNAAALEGDGSGGPVSLGCGGDVADSLGVTLDESSPGAALQLANQRLHDMRFRVSVHAWTQRDDGEMVLGPTDDVRAYPPHLEVNAHDRAKVRVLASPRFGAVERSYRIVVEEVPRAASGVRMRIAIPVFLASTSPRTSARVDEVRVGADGRVRFAIVNEGSVHIRPRAVEVVGLDARGREVEREREPGWYVLPGGVLHHELTLGASMCDVARVEVRVEGAAIAPRRAAAPSCPGA